MLIFCSWSGLFSARLQEVKNKLDAKHLKNHQNHLAFGAVWPTNQQRLHMINFIMNQSGQTDTNLLIGCVCRTSTGLHAWLQTATADKLAALLLHFVIFPRVHF